MNAKQVIAVFDSLNILMDLLPRRRLRFRAEQYYYIEPWSEDWDKEHPHYWEIYKIGSGYEIQATVADEFDLQAWLINEYNTD